VTLRELTYFIQLQSGIKATVGATSSTSTHTPPEIVAALGWALDALSTEAAKASGPRMLYEFRMDIILDQGEYPLPDEIRTIKEVWHDGFSPPQGYSRIPYTGQSFLETDAVYAPAATQAGYGYWQTHRKIHLRPLPSKTESAKLRIAAYARPPIPRHMDDEVAIPFEAERWVIAKAASLLLPPPEAGVAQALMLQLESAHGDLEMWLWRHSAGVPPAPLEDGSLI